MRVSRIAVQSGSSPGTCTQHSDECECDLFHNLFTIGGKVEGLPRGAQVTLQDTFRGQPQITAPNGAFTFPNPVTNGTAYFIQVVNPRPAGESCHVQNGRGNLRGANVTNIVVDCSKKYTIGVQVQGLGVHDQVKLEAKLTGTSIVEPKIDAPNGPLPFRFPFPAESTTT
jgi:hypothetical protein